MYCSSLCKITSGVRQGCVVAPDSFVTGVDWVMERETGRGMNGVVFGQDAYTDLDFADDISLLAELLSFNDNKIVIKKEQIPSNGTRSG